jgi:hypothetical protein
MAMVVKFLHDNSCELPLNVIFDVLLVGETEIVKI